MNSEQALRSIKEPKKNDFFSFWAGINKNRIAFSSIMAFSAIAIVALIGTVGLPSGTSEKNESDAAGQGLGQPQPQPQLTTPPQPTGTTTTLNCFDFEDSDYLDSPTTTIVSEPSDCYTTIPNEKFSELCEGRTTTQDCRYLAPAPTTPDEYIDSLCGGVTTTQGCESDIPTPVPTFAIEDDPGCNQVTTLPNCDPNYIVTTVPDFIVTTENTLSDEVRDQLCNQVTTLPTCANIEPIETTSTTTPTE